MSDAAHVSRHRPVMLAEVLAALAPRDGDIIIDGTFGAGGYTRAILEAADARVLAFDRDPDAVREGSTLVAQFANRLTLIEAPFGKMDTAFLRPDLGGSPHPLLPSPSTGEGPGMGVMRGDCDVGAHAPPHPSPRVDAKHRFAMTGEGVPDAQLSSRSAPGCRVSQVQGSTRPTALVDAVVLDIGVSSMQLDRADRGYSFQTDGPLDMRMSRAGASAADIVNDTEEAALADLIYEFGGERQSRRIARAIVTDRAKAPFTTTRQLAGMLERVLGRKHDDKKHPATRTFQALRIAVNDELGELQRGLDSAERLLRPGGRLVVVTFHSEEDRIVKRFLASRSGKHDGGSRHLPRPIAAQSMQSFQIVNPRPLTPSSEEIAANPRARSAKLRAAVRTNAPLLEVRPGRAAGR